MNSLCLSLRRSLRSAAVLVFSISAVAALDASQSKHRIVGSWLETVTSADAETPPFKSMVAFFGDGILAASDQAMGIPDTVFSTSRGAWKQLSHRRVGWTVVQLVSSSSTGALVGTVKVRGVYILAPSGDEYSGSFQAELVDTAGNVIFTLDGTNHAVRIEVE
jgi:hypothetical protein